MFAINFSVAEIPTGGRAQPLAPCQYLTSFVNILIAFVLFFKSTNIVYCFASDFTVYKLINKSDRQGAGRSSEVERSLMVRWVVGSILHGVDPLSYFSFQPVLHDWCNKGRGMCYPVSGMVHIKEPLLLIDEQPMWRQRVSFLTIRMVLNHMPDAK